jgi:type II secretory pathway pseudopilin PulG
VSVVEILVAMVLLATGVVFALSAVTYATKATAGTTQATEATAYARKILELVLSSGPKAACQNGVVNPLFDPPTFRPLYGPDGVMVPFESGDFVTTSDAQEVAEFRESARQFEVLVRVEQYLDPGPPPTPMDGLFTVDVQLRWRDRLGVRIHSFPGLFREE